MCQSSFKGETSKFTLRKHAIMTEIMKKPYKEIRKKCYEMLFSENDKALVT